VYKEVYAVRTNIVIDDKIMEKAMNISKLKTKREVVEVALNEYVLSHSIKDISELRGKIRFFDNYDYKAFRNGENDSC
jgi:Arc/MetJ family transcription regulator